MNILIYSPAFYPSIGGLENVVSDLADEFVNAGHEVKLVSQTPASVNDTKKFPFEVIRKPNPKYLLELTNWCNIYFQANISLKGIYPLLIVPRPFIVTHQGWYCRSNGSLSWQDYLKYFVTLFATNISASHAVADHMPKASTVIPNSFQDDIFFEIPEIKRDQELVFLGRLVSDKGANLLLQALANLRLIDLKPKLTVIGIGPEEASLRLQAKELGISNQVNFVGAKVGKELAYLLNTHQIMVVPSIWEEPFGIVALEGIACGCVVVGSEGGGLKEAIGSCGVTFPNGDVQALTQVLADLLTDTSKLFKYREKAALHLSKHRKAEVAKAYLQVFERAIQPISLVK
jgi:glycosyltransferase involved in cell wall biosynthesis